MPSIDPHPDLIRIGALVRARQHEAGVTQAELAGALGISRASVANICSGRQNISTVRLLHLADLLEIDVGELGGPTVAVTGKPASPDELIRVTLHVALKHVGDIERNAVAQARLLREAAARLDGHR